MELSIDTSQLKTLSKAMKEFPTIAKKALPAAINRTVSTVNTKMQKEITTRYKIKKSDLSGGSKYKGEKSNNLIKVKKASVQDPSGNINIRSGTLTLSRFLQLPKSPVPVKGKTKKAIQKIKPPKVQVKRGGTKPVKGTFVLKANGTTGIFARDENGKLRMLRTLSAAQMASNKDVMKVVEETAGETLQQRFEHEMQYRINKLAGGVNGSS
jgi:hypothetical protein